MGGEEKKDETKQEKSQKKSRIKEASNLQTGDVLKSLDEVLLVHRSGARAVPPCTQQHRKKRRKHGAEAIGGLRLLTGHASCDRVVSDLQTCCRRRRTDVERSPCSPSSSLTARLL